MNTSGEYVRMSTVIRRAGRHGLLVELADLNAVLALTRRLRAAVASGEFPAGIEVLPAARTVLLHLPPEIDTAATAQLRDRLTELADRPALAHHEWAQPVEVVIEVRYDGPDLAELTELTGMTRAEIIGAHTGRPWRAAFTGFAPGFCYLTDGDPRLDVPRRPESRPVVAAGSVAVANGCSAVYPTASPGGWRILGSTERQLWDLAAAEPALIRPGMTVRFVEADGGEPPGDAETGGRSVDEVPESDAAATGLVVIRPGPLSLLEDAGRPGHAASGVGRSGAADRASHRLANLLVGNPAEATAIECALGGLVVQARGSQVLAVTGAPAPASVDGVPVEHGKVFTLGDGETLTLRAPRSGLRSYVAVRGGLETAPVLGSRSADVLSGLGPAPLRRHDVLPVGTFSAQGAAATAAGTVIPEIGETLVLRAALGPRDDWFVNPEQLAAGEWVVSAQSNRVGLRLDRAAAEPGPEWRDSRELASEGVVLGSIQVPPSGQPVLFLVDHPVTGGYPVVAVVEPSDVDRAAQARPGQRIRFDLVEF